MSVEVHQRTGERKDVSKGGSDEVGVAVTVQIADVSDSPPLDRQWEARRRCLREASLAVVDQQGVDGRNAFEQPDRLVTLQEEILVAILVDVEEIVVHVELGYRRERLGLGAPGSEPSGRCK